MREFETWLIQGLRTNSALVALLGVDTSGIPAIFPDVMRDKDPRVPYPHLTVTRFSSIKSTALFDEQQNTAGMMDCPVIAMCGWSQTSKDNAYQIYQQADQMLRGQGAAHVANAYFAGYKISRRAFRDNLYDDKAEAYHVHGEYALWAQLTTTAQPY